MPDADIGLVGLSVMGGNLVPTMERNGFRGVVFNRTRASTEKFMGEKAKGKNIAAAFSLEDFVKALKKPRRVMLMVKAGAPVDALIDKLAPLLDAGDIIIDGGNSHFKDTMRRDTHLVERGIRFLGVGVSGGEKGALEGPAIMPGGARDAYEAVEPVLTKIAAKVGGEPCCTYIGPGGAGHFVKMVHNGIEYGDMQLIAEAYQIMRDGLRLPVPEISDVFGMWNEGELESYLIEITADVLGQADSSGDGYLVDHIVDAAGAKGTGAWTVAASLELGVAVPTIFAAVATRAISSHTDERKLLAGELAVPVVPQAGDNLAFVEILEQALYVAKISSYAQGMGLIAAAARNRDYGFGSLDLAAIAGIWRGGCIIRARFLDDIARAFEESPGLANLMAARTFAKRVQERLPSLAEVTTQARSMRVPTMAMDASLAYILEVTSARLPGASLTQAQRDYFGSHTYQRTDAAGVFHTEWTTPGRPEVKQE